MKLSIGHSNIDPFVKQTFWLFAFECWRDINPVRLVRLLPETLLGPFACSGNLGNVGIHVIEDDTDSTSILRIIHINDCPAKGAPRQTGKLHVCLGCLLHYCEALNEGCVVKFGGSHRHLVRENFGMLRGWRLGATGWGAGTAGGLGAAGSTKRGPGSSVGTISSIICGGVSTMCEKVSNIFCEVDSRASSIGVVSMGCCSSSSDKKPCEVGRLRGVAMDAHRLLNFTRYRGGVR